MCYLNNLNIVNQLCLCNMDIDVIITQLRNSYITYSFDAELNMLRCKTIDLIPSDTTNGIVLGTDNLNAIVIVESDVEEELTNGIVMSCMILGAVRITTYYSMIPHITLIVHPSLSVQKMGFWDDILSDVPNPIINCLKYSELSKHPNGSHAEILSASDARDEYVKSLYYKLD